MTSCRTETETVSRMEKAGLFDCCCNHQRRRRLSDCVRAHGVHFDHIFCEVFTVHCVKLMLKILKFLVLLFDCFVFVYGILLTHLYYYYYYCYNYYRQQVKYYNYMPTNV